MHQRLTQVKYQVRSDWVWSMLNALVCSISVSVEECIVSVINRLSHSSLLKREVESQGDLWFVPSAIEKNN